jgi:hypothetical protein
MEDYLADMFWVALMVVGVFGWVLNIVELIQGGESTGLMLARVAGIFVAPLGAILGLFV